MTTIFDVITVTCFAGLVIAFFLFTQRSIRTLTQFILAGVAFAVANQVGNAGGTLLACALILAGACYVGVAVQRELSET